MSVSSFPVLFYLFCGAAVITSQTQSMKYSKSITALFKQTAWLLGERKRELLWLTMIAAVSSTTALIPPWILGRVLGEVSDRKPLSNISLYCVGMFILMGILHSVRVTAKKRIAVIQADISAWAREQVVDQLLAQGLREGRLIGNEVSRLDFGLRDFAELFRIAQNELIFSSVNFIACLILFFNLDQIFILYILAYLSSVIIILRIMLPQQQAAQLAVSKARENFSGLFANVVGSSLSVRAAGAEENVVTQVGSSARELEKLESLRARLTARQWLAFNMLNSAFLGLGLWRLGMQGLAGVISVPLIVVSFGYIREFVSATLRVFEIADSLIQSLVGYSRMLALISLNEQVLDRTRTLSTKWQEINFSEVTHCYKQDARAALSNFDLRIKRGERLGLKGPSGSGKSTIVKILLGLLEPTSGKVFVDGEPLSHFSFPSLRAQMAVALQECEILSFSLRDNLCMFRSVSPEWLAEVIEFCSLSEVVARLPQGLDSVLGEKGYQLSGGERQRVSLARAVLRKPSLLIVDEASSMLDEDTEQKFFEGLLKALPEITLLLISHHERLWKYVDRVQIMPEALLPIRRTK